MQRAAGQADRARRAAVVAVALAAAVAGAARALEVVAEPAAWVEWAPATGEVAAYAVFVSRNGGPYRSEQYTREPRARIGAQPGESVQVRVRAYGLADGQMLTSAASEPSELIRFAPDESPPQVAPVPQVASAPPPAAAALVEAAGVRRIPGFQFAPPLRVEAHGDFDGDGDLDLLATLGSWRHPIALFLEDGSLEHAVVLASLAGTSAALAADFDGDGRDDVALRSGDRLTVQHVDRNGLLSLLRRETIPSSARILAADLDGDSAASLVVYDPTTGRLGERLGARDTDFGTVRPLHALHAGDFDGDGRDDLWVQPTPGPDAELWLMSAGGSFEVATIRLGRSVVAGAVADVNGDGRADFTGYDAGRDELHAWLLDGGSVVGERRLARGAVDSVQSGDVDGDGLDDLLLHTPSGEASALVLSQ